MKVCKRAECELPARPAGRVGGPDYCSGLCVTKDTPAWRAKAAVEAVEAAKAAAKASADAERAARGAARRKAAEAKRAEVAARRVQREAKRAKRATRQKVSS